jgi:hypothetical protein
MRNGIVTRQYIPDVRLVRKEEVLAGVSRRVSIVYYLRNSL